MLPLFTASSEVRPAAHDWRQHGFDLAKAGSVAFDECIELVTQHIGDPRLRAEVLQEWGIADAALQLEAWYYWRDLPADDPLQQLSNSQRVVLFGQPEVYLNDLLEAARDLIRSGRPAGRISSGWVSFQIERMKIDQRETRRAADRRTGYLTSAQRVILIEQQVQDLEQQLAEAKAENARMEQLIEQMLNGTAVLEAAA